MCFQIEVFVNSVETYIYHSANPTVQRARAGEDFLQKIPTV